MSLTIIDHHSPTLDHLITDHLINDHSLPHHSLKLQNEYKSPLNGLLQNDFFRHTQRIGTVGCKKKGLVASKRVGCIRRTIYAHLRNIFQ